MHLTLKRTPGLFLVGFMASGKTTAGPLLAERLGWHFADIDAAIERAQAATIREIFQRLGETGFRALETAAIENQVQKIRCGTPSVVALGGGAFVQERNWALIRDYGISIWLDCPLSRIEIRLAKDTTRPLVMGGDAVAALYEARQKLYARADYRVDADCDDPEQVIERIAALPIFHG